MRVDAGPTAEQAIRVALIDTVCPLANLASLADMIADSTMVRICPDVDALVTATHEPLAAHAGVLFADLELRGALVDALAGAHRNTYVAALLLIVGALVATRRIGGTRIAGAGRYARTLAALTWHLPGRAGHCLRLASAEDRILTKAAGHQDDQEKTQPHGELPSVFAPSTRAASACLRCTPPGWCFR